MQQAFSNFSGVVVHGAGRGRQIGFPTLNLKVEGVGVPEPGVYSVQVNFDTEQNLYWGAMHVGPRPTFAEEALSVEIHLLDFEGDVYGAMTHVQVEKKLREIIKFDSREALVQQISADIEQVKSLAKN